MATATTFSPKMMLVNGRPLQPVLSRLHLNVKSLLLTPTDEISLLGII